MKEPLSAETGPLSAAFQLTKLPDKAVYIMVHETAFVAIRQWRISLESLRDISSSTCDVAINCIEHDSPLLDNFFAQTDHENGSQFCVLNDGRITWKLEKDPQAESGEAMTLTIPLPSKKPRAPPKGPAGGAERLPVYKEPAINLTGRIANAKRSSGYITVHEFLGKQITVTLYDTDPDRLAAINALLHDLPADTGVVIRARGPGSKTEDKWSPRCLCIIDNFSAICIGAATAQ